MEDIKKELLKYLSYIPNWEREKYVKLINKIKGDEKK